MSEMNPEIGRELKVSELQLKTMVVICKPGRPAATMWVIGVSETHVHFRAGAIGMEFLAKRIGDGITDDDNLPMKIYAYLGKV